MKKENIKVYIQIMTKESRGDWKDQPAMLEEFESREQAAFWARTTANLMEFAIRLSYPEGVFENTAPTNLNGSYFSRQFDYKPKVYLPVKAKV